MKEKIDAIVILGGGLKKDKNGWRTTNFDEPGDNFGVQGDRLRVDAAYQLYQNLSVKNSNLLIISSGGRGQLKNIPDSPSVASIIKKELLVMGIPEEKILLEENSNNTYQQLQQLILIIQNLHLKNCLILSNGWHLPRIQSMIEGAKDLLSLKRLLIDNRLKLISAEEILLEYDKKNWKDIIAKAYKSKSLKRRIVLEQKGVAEIKSGVYKFR